MEKIKDNWKYILFTVALITAMILTRSPRPVINNSNRVELQKERDSLLNRVYESEKQLIKLNNYIKYLEYEIEKDRAIINGATTSELIDLTAEFMRRIGQHDSLR